MTFSNKDKKPFSHIYIELLTKTAPHYLFNPKYSAPTKSLPVKPKDNYSYPDVTNHNQSNGKSDFSIDSILSQESDALGDKIKNSVMTIADRLQINTEFNYIMNNNWLYIRNKMLELGVDDKYNTNVNHSDRRSALESQLVSIEKDILQEKVKCWQDLVKPSMYFIDLFHKYQGLKQDKKLIE